MLDESTWDPDDEDLPALPPRRRPWVALARTLGVVLALGAGAWGWVTFLAPAPTPVIGVGPGEGAAVTPGLPEPRVSAAPDLPLDAETSRAAAAPPAPPPAAIVAPRGRLVVSATPWAEVYVDGRLVGNTPVVDLPVSAGTHRLRLVREGFVPDERVVVVSRGQTLRVTGIKLREFRP